jgi:hypothetical protein
MFADKILQLFSCPIPSGTDFVIGSLVMLGSDPGLKSKDNEEKQR